MRSRQLRLVTLLSAVVIILSICGEAFGQTSRISGQVLGSGRRPVSEVYVELMNEVNTILARTRTDGSGIYMFAGLSGGRFTIRVRPFGTDYEEQTQDVEVVAIVYGGRMTSDSRQVDFFLRSRTDANKTKTINAVVHAQEVPKDAKTLYEKAVGDLAANRIDNAVVGLELAIKTFPTYFDALDRLGITLIRQHKYVEAQPYLERAVAINQRSSNTWYGLAFVLCAQDKAKDAVVASKKAFELAPDSADINLILGMSLRKDKQFADAETAMLKAKKISDGKSADVLWNLALLYNHDLKKNKRAAEELEAYLKLKPDHPDAANIKKLIQQLRSANQS